MADRARLEVAELRAGLEAVAQHPCGQGRSIASPAMLARRRHVEDCRGSLHVNPRAVETIAPPARPTYQRASGIAWTAPENRLNSSTGRFERRGEDGVRLIDLAVGNELDLDGCAAVPTTSPVAPTWRAPAPRGSARARPPRAAPVPAPTASAPTATLRPPRPRPRRPPALSAARRSPRSPTPRCTAGSVPLAGARRSDPRAARTVLPRTPRRGVRTPSREPDAGAAGAGMDGHSNRAVASAHDADGMQGAGRANARPAPCLRPLGPGAGCRPVRPLLGNRRRRLRVVRRLDRDVRQHPVEPARDVPRLLAQQGQEGRTRASSGR